MAHLRAEPVGEQSVKLLAVAVSCLCVNRKPRLYCCCYCFIWGFLWDACCSLMSVSCCSARKGEREREKQSIPSHQGFAFAAVSSTAAYTFAHERSTCTCNHTFQNADMHSWAHTQSHTHTHMHAAHSVREGSASLTQHGKIRLLCNSEICNLHVNNPWSAASPGRSASSLSLPTPLALCVPILSLHPQTSSSIPPSLQPHLASPDCKYRNNRKRKKTEAGYSQRMREGRELLRACAESQWAA